MEVIASESIKQNVLLSLDIVYDIVVVDSGNIGNPPIRPLDGIIWHCLSGSGRKEHHIQYELDPSHGLTFTRTDGALPFIQMPSTNVVRHAQTNNDQQHSFGT